MHRSTKLTRQPLHQYLLITIFILVTACAMTEERIDDAALNVERYILAKVNGDADKLRDYLCSEMENEWEREAHSFDTVTGVSVQNLSCKRRGIQEIVDCQGEILANYGGEQRIFPVGTYRIVWEASSWKWCGELEP